MPPRCTPEAPRGPHPAPPPPPRQVAHVPLLAGNGGIHHRPADLHPRIDPRRHPPVAPMLPHHRRQVRRLRIGRAHGMRHAVNIHRTSARPQLTEAPPRSPAASPAGRPPALRRPPPSRAPPPAPPPSAPGRAPPTGRINVHAQAHGRLAVSILAFCVIFYA